MSAALNLKPASASVAESVLPAMPAPIISASHSTSGCCAMCFRNAISTTYSRCRSPRPIAPVTADVAKSITRSACSQSRIASSLPCLPPRSRGAPGPGVREALKRTTGADLDGALLRIEYSRTSPGSGSSRIPTSRSRRSRCWSTCSMIRRWRWPAPTSSRDRPTHRYVTTAPYGRDLMVSCSYRAIRVGTPSAAIRSPSLASRSSSISVSPESRAVNELA